MLELLPRDLTVLTAVCGLDKPRGIVRQTRGTMATIPYAEAQLLETVHIMFLLTQRDRRAEWILALMIFPAGMP